jgi:tape measure domain-containing protein
MSALDKLKQSLRFTGATKGFEDVSTAARRVDLSGLGSAVETVGLKFSAMYTVADQALRNITNSAMAAGKRIVSALTIDPIKTGFSEYETQINSVQTILANTESKGTTLGDVNRALDTLNTYADKTIYNFTEMTRNIGTFTAAGVDLDTSVNAIQGIANLAAVSGSTSQQASTAMYQLSQALSSGTVKLMDWNSVVNAGMGGQVFQDALKETARVHGVAIDQMIKEQGSFRETLSKGWLTADILTETLSKFTMTTEGLSKAQIEQNRQSLKAKGYTDEQIESIFKLGNTATNAATKVKTFTQLWDTLKESAQSGWTQSWETIVGDFGEAKEFLTQVSDTIGELIGASSDRRNNLLSGGLDSNWKKLVNTINDAGIETAAFESSIRKVVNDDARLDALIEHYGSIGNVFKEGALSSDYLTKALDAVTKSTADYL